ncbi:MAG: precorrin-3B C(17)-methyltransferase [Alphaproteobacteria bacterium GM7ARS4]|nr:precorrin-3B C(17)-methyltransferase [Alphaproteobacteria bacterium GM7ARS4]
MTHPVAIITTQRHALERGRALRAHIPHSVLYAPHPCCPQDAIPYTSLEESLHTLFRQKTAIIALCSVSILVRLLAPLIEKNARHPPVIALTLHNATHDTPSHTPSHAMYGERDTQRPFVIPLLSSHQASNSLARTIASIVNGVACISTLSDTLYDIAFDAPPEGWRLATKKHYKAWIRRLVNGTPLHISHDDSEGTRLPPTWHNTLRQLSAIKTDIKTDNDPSSHLHITTQWRHVKTDNPNLLTYVPQCLALGIGCESGTDPQALLHAVKDVCQRHNLSLKAIGGIFSIALKRHEPAIHALQKTLACPFTCYSAEQLLTCTDRLKTPSNDVFAITGCYGVAEGAALLGAGPAAKLLIPKHITGQITLAIAVAPQPLKQKKHGHIAIIGTGPGHTAMLTIDAHQQLQACDDVVGYQRYLHLLEPMLHTQQRHPFPLGEEEKRCKHAIQLAQTGRHVGLVSSGDPALYALASLAMQCLQADDSTEPLPSLSIHPGVTAAHAASARMGAPLSYDFCAISLSDLLTPWPTIEKRLLHAAMGDFMTALYNPRSQERTQAIIHAQRIFLDHRHGETCVLIARNLYRQDESLTISTLKDFLTHPIDMLTLILIGTEQTKTLDYQGKQYLYTPRGYAITPPAP